MFIKLLVCYKSNQTDCGTESNPKLKPSLGSVPDIDQFSEPINLN